MEEWGLSLFQMDSNVRQYTKINLRYYLICNLPDDKYFGFSLVDGNVFTFNSAEELGTFMHDHKYTNNKGAGGFKD